MFRRIAAAVVAAAAIVIGGATFASTATAGAKADKITICHRTDSNTNPYVEITVSENSTQLNGHEGHTGPVWNPSLKAQHIKWGDIIIDASDGDGSDVVSLNDNAAGRAILANGCVIPGQSTPTPTPRPTPTSTPTPTPTPTPSSTPTVSPRTTPNGPPPVPSTGAGIGKG